jgi:hypothetical protein
VRASRLLKLSWSASTLIGTRRGGRGGGSGLRIVAID